MRKILCLLMATLLLVGLCFALTSCGECKHTEFAEEYEIVDPTCTTDGKYVYTCLKCNEKVEIAPEADDTSMLKTGHTADNGAVTTEPTCTADGEKTFKCKVCDAAMPEKTEAVPALGHDVDEEAYESNGTTHWNVCEREGCGAKVNEVACEMDYVGVDDDYCAKVCFVCSYVDEDSKIEHDFDAGEVTREATCSKKGEMTYTCENCGYEIVEDIAVVPHTYDTTAFESDGTNHWHACSECGAKDEDSVAACEYGTPVVVNPEAGSCKPGTSTATCTACGNAKVTAIPAEASHKLSNVSHDAANGVVSYTCSVCEAIYQVSGVGTVYDCETSATEIKTYSAVSYWSTTVEEDENGNSYVSATVGALPDDKLDNYFLQGPFKGLDGLKSFILDFDVMANPEMGMCGSTTLACKGSSGWFGGNNLLTINQDGSITGGNAYTEALAPAGTVNSNEWTHVTIECDLVSGDVSFYINGTLAATANGTALMSGRSLTYINVIIPMAADESQIGCGICLDNMALATGEGAGVALQVAN